MTITYDPEADAAYITVRKGFSARTEKIDRYTLIDFTKDNKLLGIELLCVKERKLLKALKGRKILA